MGSLRTLAATALLAAHLAPGLATAGSPADPPAADPSAVIDRAMSEAGLPVRSAPPPKPDVAAVPPVAEAITVAITTAVVRAVDNYGEPLRGLTAADFRARMGDQAIPILAVDWISSEPAGSAPAEEADEEGGPAPRPWPAAPEPPRGQLRVFFVQSNLEPTRAKGQLRLLPPTRELIGTFRPDDRAAVVSFDSHLKLWLDFTDDREAIYDAITRAVRTGGEPWARDNREVHSLTRHLDRDQAQRAASPERALAVLGEALQGLPGDKTIVYLGWGLGRYGMGGVTMTPDYAPALLALRTARASVFVLDVTSDDYHSLEVGLQSIARATGGTYSKTHLAPEQVVHRLARTLSGHYLVTLDRQAMPKGGGRLTIELKGKKGEILTAPLIGP